MTDVTVRFFRGAPDTGVQIGEIAVGAVATDAASPFFTFTPAASAWTEISVPLSALSNPAAIQRISLQEFSGAAQPMFYVDDLRLTVAVP